MSSAVAGTQQRVVVVGLEPLGHQPHPFLGWLSLREGELVKGWERLGGGPLFLHQIMGFPLAPSPQEGGPSVGAEALCPFPRPYWGQHSSIGQLLGLSEAPGAG